jgi:predicted lysophospholipase L1 biosynthesis ABC-type transport system permease subunit
MGVYGLMSYLVTRRTHEIGIRLALGAGRGHVFGIVIGRGAVMILSGIVLGELAALLLTRLLSHQLFGVTATDPAIFVSVTLLLILVELSACYFPARRALRIDPLTALRQEPQNRQIIRENARTTLGCAELALIPSDFATVSACLDSGAALLSYAPNASITRAVEALQITLGGAGSERQGFLGRSLSGFMKSRSP